MTDFIWTGVSGISAAEKEFRKVNWHGAVGFPFARLCIGNQESICRVFPELASHFRNVLGATSAGDNTISGFVDSSDAAYVLVEARRVLSTEPPPGLGDLLRAMRLRRGLTQEAVGGEDYR